MNKKELVQLFSAPGAEYRGKPFWSWNGELEEKELKRQVDVMKEMGLGGYFMHSRAGLITEYLGDEWFDLINKTADHGEQVGMESWLYDEDRWPSGSAGGKVTIDPQYRMKSLYIFESSPDKYTPAEQETALFSAELEGVRLGKYERIRPEDVKNVPADRKILQFRVIPDQPNNNYNGTTYIDTMSEKAVDRFIELTHEEYKKRCGDRLGKNIKGIFTDEPNRGFALSTRTERDGVVSSTAPYTDDLFEEFEKRYGYDLLPVLPELFYQKNGDPYSKIKLNFFDLTCNLFVERFMKRINDWCDKNGILFTGHVLHEDNLTCQTVPNGSLMRNYAVMGLPGIDLLSEFNRCYWITKQLSSVCRQQGKKFMLSELYGCTGWQFNMRSHKVVGDWQALFGINLRCQHLSWYTMEGESKRDYPASILHQSPWYKDYSYVETYFARFGVLMAEGVPCCETLVLNPIESIWIATYLGWAHGLSCASPVALKTEDQYAKTFTYLTSNHIDFDYGEEQLMATMSSVDGDKLRVGNCAYKTVIASGMTTMRRSTLELLKKFRAAGGKVIFTGDIASYVDGERSDEVIDFSRECEIVEFTADKLAAAVGYDAVGSVSLKNKDDKPEKDVFVQLRYSPDADCYIACLLNTDRDKPRDVTAYFRIPAGYTVERWDMVSGRRTAVPYSYSDTGILSVPVSLYAAGSDAFVFAKQAEELPEDKIYEPTSESVIEGEFDYEKDEPDVCVLDFAKWRLEGGEFSEEKESLKIDQSVRDHFGLEHRGGGMVQPWYAKLHYKEVYGNIELQYTFDIEQMPEGNVYLCGERPEFNEYSINGVVLSCPDPDDFYIDNCLKKMPVPKSALRIGENTVTVRVAFMRTTNIESLYLIGKFGVRIDGHRRYITSLPDRIGFGEAKDYNMPFYTGCITYVIPNGRFPKPAEGERVIVRAADYFGGLVKVNGQILAWEPYEADVTEAVTSGEDVRITLVGTRRNLFGPLHLVPVFDGAYGPGHFVTGGDRWTDDYNLIPAHLGKVTVKTAKPI